MLPPFPRPSVSPSLTINRVQWAWDSADWLFPSLGLLGTQFPLPKWDKSSSWD